MKYECINHDASVRFSIEASTDEGAAYLALNTLGWYLGREDGYDEEEDE